MSPEIANDFFLFSLRNIQWGYAPATPLHPCTTVRFGAESEGKKKGKMRIYEGPCKMAHNHAERVVAGSGNS
jgi:hypothetical protein